MPIAGSRSPVLGMVFNRGPSAHAAAGGRPPTDHAPPARSLRTRLRVHRGSPLRLMTTILPQVPDGLISRRPGAAPNAIQDEPRQKPSDRNTQRLRRGVRGPYGSLNGVSPGGRSLRSVPRQHPPLKPFFGEHRAFEIHVPRHGEGEAWSRFDDPAGRPCRPDVCTPHGRGASAVNRAAGPRAAGARLLLFLPLLLGLGGPLFQKSLCGLLLGIPLLVHSLAHDLCSCADAGTGSTLPAGDLRKKVPQGAGLCIPGARAAWVFGLTRA